MQKIMKNKVRLGVNIDHVATLRNARGGVHPCPVEMALLAQAAGADGITAHLREDRRHVRDNDIMRLKQELHLPLNFEMAATDEMQQIALQVLPNAVCLVPEKRSELTTEGGLDVAGNVAQLQEFLQPLRNAGIKISLFIDADMAQLQATKQVGADIVELHTGAYCEEPSKHLLQKLQNAANESEKLGIEVHAGHGLCYATTPAIAVIPQVVEVNIGHFIMGEALRDGLPSVIAKFNLLLMR
jgi:pyridoxine 5-phosphate synthase